MLLSWLATKYNNDKKFDVDLEYGQQREKEIANILEKGKLEVKSERSWWWRTKNIAIFTSAIWSFLR